MRQYAPTCVCSSNSGGDTAFRTHCTSSLHSANSSLFVDMDMDWWLAPSAYEHDLAANYPPRLPLVLVFVFYGVGETELAAKRAREVRYIYAGIAHSRCCLFLRRSLLEYFLKDETRRVHERHLNFF